MGQQLVSLEQVMPIILVRQMVAAVMRLVVVLALVVMEATQMAVLQQHRP
jgi:hypothetical protein